MTWETAEMMKTVKDKGVKKEMEKARELPMAKSMRERITAKGMEKRMEKVLAGRAGPGDTEDRGAVMLWQQLCAQARDMGGGKGEELRGRREQEGGERWDPSEGIEAHGPGVAIKRHKGEEKGDKRCADEWKGGAEPDEEGAAVWVDWQSDSDLIRREGDEENANVMRANAMEYPTLRACMRSKKVEGEGVRLEDGKILRMEKGKAEMDKVTGVKAAYIVHSSPLPPLRCVFVVSPPHGHRHLRPFVCGCSPSSHRFFPHVSVFLPCSFQYVTGPATVGPRY